MVDTFNIIILASGNGTNLGAILDAKREGKLKNVQILGVISDVENSGALKKVGKDRKGVFIDPKGKARDQFNAELIEAVDQLSEHEIDLICLIGYMRILSPEFIQKYRGKIINVHPSLLPKYGGVGMYGDRVHKAVLEAGETESGMTIHYVDEGIDSGEVILQKKIEISEGETVESLKEKVQEAEKQGYVEVLEKLSSNMV